MLAYPGKGASITGKVEVPFARVAEILNGKGLSFEGDEELV